MEQYATWHPSGRPSERIDYKALRKINPEAARQAVLEHLGLQRPQYHCHGQGPSATLRAGSLASLGPWSMTSWPSSGQAI